MKKRLQQLAISFLVIYVILSIIDIGISRKLKEEALFSGEVQQWQQIGDGKITTDIAVMGSSRAFIHINPRILEEELNQRVYNFGLNGSKFGLQYYRFKLYLKHNPRPQTIVWVLDSFSFSKINKLYQPNQYVPFMLFNFPLYGELKPYSTTNVFDFILPLWRYRDYSYWKDEIAKAQKLKEDGLYRYKGFKSYKRAWTVDLDKLQAKNAEFDTVAYTQLDELIKRCEKKGIRLVFTMAPEYIVGQEKMLNRQTIVDSYKKKLAGKKQTFIDYSTDSLSYQKKWFYNSTHMNADGAKVFSEKLAKDLKHYL